MATRRTAASETLESRWFLSTVSGVAHAAPEAAAAVHATPQVDGQASGIESGDGEETAVAAAPAPVAAAPVRETEDQGDGAAASGSVTSNESVSAPSAAVTPAVDAPLPVAAIAAPFSRAPAPIAKVVLADAFEGFSGGVQPLQLPGEVTPVVAAAVFNTGHPINPHEGALPVATLTAAAPATAVVRAVRDLAAGGSPLILKSGADGMLALTQPDLLATFADAVTGFAHESAAQGALASPEAHFYKWQVTLGVLGTDALLVGHWYAARRRAAAAKEGHSPFSTQSV